MKQPDATLNLTSDINVIGSVVDFTYKWCINAGLVEDDAIRVTQALDEIVTDIVLFAYPEQKEPGHFEVDFSSDSSSVQITVHEYGEPFDPDRHLYDSKKAIEENDFDGAGFELIKYLADEFTFENRGAEGKIFRLIKYIITDQEPDLLPEQSPETEKAELDHEEFIVAPIDAHDAEDIAKLVYRSYGYSYPKEDLYFPKRIAMAVIRKKKIGVIARTEEGRPAGYFAILETTDSDVGEVGEAVVAPAFRRKGLFKKMMEMLIENAKESKLQGIFGKAIGLHDISQKVNQQYGFKTTGILLADFPAVHLYELLDPYPQPVSEIVDFLILKKYKKQTVYLPNQYHDLLRDIYAQFDIHPNYKEPESEPARAPFTDLDMKVDYNQKNSLLTLRSAGRNVLKAIEHKFNYLKSRKINIIYIDLPLEDPVTPMLIEPLHNMGFVFSGLMPHFHKGKDHLRLQYTLCDLDLSLIVTYSEMSKRVLNQVKQEMNHET
ncbi:MAG: GNAT family N-acetyltransferase [Bacteroidetes bacterium]|jgi:anti-sigma regulatory factor (Ser/Thr protein kinase)/GNAT superfamily N-acetyltransferase|nr:GNAT family N-acetyltransferase [Bacteroidota bacterium]